MPAPVIVHTPSNHRQRQDLRRQELDNQYLDDGWACYDVPPPEQSPEWMLWLAVGVLFSLVVGVFSWIRWDLRNMR